MTRLLATVVLVFVAAPALAAEAIAGRVVSVSDGDTLTILVDHRTMVVRLDGVDAPEKGQPFGMAAKRHLSDLAFDRTVTATCSKVDRYRRHVCAVHVSDRDVGAELVAAGHAWLFTRYAHELSPARRAAYEDAERTARDERLGLWRDSSPVPPWEWRQARRSPSDQMGTWGHRTGSPRARRLALSGARMTRRPLRCTLPERPHIPTSNSTLWLEALRYR